MSTEKQIFQSLSPKRWKRFIWAFRGMMLVFILSIAGLVSSIFDKSEATLPSLINKNEIFKRLFMHDKVPAALTSDKTRKYHLACKQMQEHTITPIVHHPALLQKIPAKQIRVPACG